MPDRVCATTTALVPWGLVATLAAGPLLAGCALLEPMLPYGPTDAYGPAEVGADGGARPEVELPEEALTLSRAVEIALANNPSLAARQWETEAADAARNVARAEALPHVSAVAGYTHGEDPLKISPPGPPFVVSRNVMSAGLVVRMSLFTGGRIVSRIQAAELLEKAATHRLARTREELVFNVTSVYCRILAQRHVIESIRFSRKTLREHLDRVEALVAQQQAAPVDRLRTEVRLADVEEQLVRATNLLEIQKRTLVNLLGIEGPADDMAVAGELTPDGDDDPRPLEVLLEAAFADRDDYLAAKRSLEAQARRVDVARAAYWPDVFLQGTYGADWDAADWGRSEDVATVGVGVEVPLFEGGRIPARIREERSRLAAAQEALRELRLRIRLEVETARLNLASARERVEATRKAIEKGKESLRIERLKYRNAKASITDVLDAQDDLLNAQTNYYHALADHHVATAELRRAIGQEGAAE